MRRNGGAAGIDGTTLADVEEYGVERLLDEVAEELKGGRWRPLPARRVLIPKPGTSEQRPLSIPSVRDRVVEAAVKIVLEPIFESGFLPCSFGFCPRRSAHDALQVLVDEIAGGLLSHAAGNNVPAAILTGGGAFAGAVGLLLAIAHYAGGGR